MVRDARETKKRLLNAAADEFARYGIAGARVDRIAAAAGANKALIYTYFGNKDQLFDAVFADQVTDTVADVPFTADDLPTYAGRLFDRHQSHPHVVRLAVWHTLERGDTVPLPETTAHSDAAKVAAIAAAQRAGRVSDRFPPGELLVLVIGLSILGTPIIGPMPFPDDAARARRRQTVTDAVAQLTEVRPA